MGKKKTKRPQRKKFAGKTYAVISGSYSRKSNADKTAKRHRKAGWNARVSKGNDNRYYVYRRDREEKNTSRAGSFAGQKRKGGRR